MKSSIWFILLIALAFPVLGWGDPGAALYVQVKSSKLREQPKHWARGVQDLAFGDRLAEVSRNASWIRVRSATGAEGFVHETAVSDRRVVLKGNTQTTDLTADAADIVLAGKGFNKEIESSLAVQEQELNFEAVDEMEQISVSPEQLHSFIVEGKLKDGESGGGSVQ